MAERPPASPEADEELSHSYWDESADAWNHFVESGLDYYRVELHGPALLEACGEVTGLEVLDLGCGQGWFSRQVASRPEALARCPKLADATRVPYFLIFDLRAR
ncbi:hypothetical protein [Archangium sp.]|uniref:hypothetical protein n=1 Tax=Archangium sp. TaxID=1872627 RepID=UPI00389AD257